MIYTQSADVKSLHLVNAMEALNMYYAELIHIKKRMGIRQADKLWFYYELCCNYQDAAGAFIP